jgi:Tol biopolymer transport system component
VMFSVDDDGLPGTDGTMDIYVRDRWRGRTRLVSQNSAGDPADGSSSDAIAISQDGRFAAFSVAADNLPGGVNTADVYLRDLVRRKTRLISKTSGGDVLDGESEDPSVSADGRFVAFQSGADNLPGDDNYADVYVHDRKTGRTRLVSKTSGGVPANEGSDSPSLSGDGSRVSFGSRADNLPGPDGIADVFVHNLRTGKTRLVSKTSGGENLDAGSFVILGAMSGSGRVVVFESDATNLPGADATTDVYVHDLRTGRTRLVSKTSGGVPADQSSDTAAVSGSGRFVVFESDAENLPGAPGLIDVFMHDRRTGSTRLVSRATSGAVGNEDSFYVSISANARFVAFTSRADGFSGADDNNYSNVFVRGPLQ